MSGKIAEAVVEARGLTRAFGPIEALRGTDLDLLEGQLLSLVGPSGGGKTTLLRILGLLDRFDKGWLRLLGRKVTSNGHAAEVLDLRRRMAMVQQKPVVFSRSVSDNIALGLRFRGESPSVEERKVSKAIELVRLEGLEHRRAPTLSGGEAQRVAFARAIVVEPKLLLLDEFTANLDPHHVKILERALLTYLAEEPSRTALVVTHNLPQARRLGGDLAVMVKGRIEERGSTARMFEKPQNELVTAFLKGEMIY